MAERRPSPLDNVARKGSGIVSSTTNIGKGTGRRTSRPNSDLRALNTAATIAIILAVIYAIPHIWWGFGINWLAPADMQSDQGLGSSSILTFIAFYGMGALAFLSAVLTWKLNLVRSGPTRVPAWFLALHGWRIGILLALRGGIGLVESSLVLTGVRDCPFMGCGSSEPGRDSSGMTGMFWEPLFAIWSVALLTTVALWSRMRRQAG